MKRHLLPALLVTCTLIVALWLIMARQNGRSFKPFELTAADFFGFNPSLQGWAVRSIPVSTNDPAEPNIAAFVVESGKGGAESGKREEEGGKREEEGGKGGAESGKGGAESGKGQEEGGKREEGKTLSLGTVDPVLPANPQFPIANLQSPASRLPLTPCRISLTAVVRLVHGYNMPMCMKIKGYTVEAYGNVKPETRTLSQKKTPDQETRENPQSDLSPQVSGFSPQVSSASSSPMTQVSGLSPQVSSASSSPMTQVSGFSPQVSSASSSPLTQVSGFSPQVSSSASPDSPLPLASFPLPLQLWRVTSSDGERSVWVTTMIRAGDFASTAEDICSMAFPRVDVADDPRWVPRGFTWADLRHPVASLRRWSRARWNASRTDLLTFLRLRQPAWASEELLTYVTRNMSPEITGENEEEVLKSLITVHTRMLESLQAWRVSQLKGQ